jgi:hypothetical protein
MGDDVATYERCVTHLRSHCAGTGAIPFVWFQRGPLGMGDDPFTQGFSRWVAATYGVAATVEDPALDAVITLIPRLDQP